MSVRVVKIYQDSIGKEPYTSWIQSLKDARTKARIQQRIRRLELGHFGDHKSLGQGIWELKLDFGPGFRIYYAEEASEIVILLCGGDKKSQERDIEKAKAFWKEYKEAEK